MISIDSLIVLESTLQTLYQRRDSVAQEVTNFIASGGDLSACSNFGGYLDLVNELNIVIDMTEVAKVDMVSIVQGSINTDTIWRCITLVQGATLAYDLLRNKHSNILN